MGQIEDKSRWMKTESQMMDHQFSVQSDLQQKSRNTSLIDQNTEMRTCRTKETGQKERRNVSAFYNAAVGEEASVRVEGQRRDEHAVKIKKRLNNITYIIFWQPGHQKCVWQLNVLNQKINVSEVMLSVLHFSSYIEIK